MKKENKMSDDFKDIEKESNVKTYVIVGILYVLVIILTVLLVLGIKEQKKTILDNSNDNNSQETNTDNNTNINENNSDDETNIEEPNEEENNDEEDTETDNVEDEPPVTVEPSIPNSDDSTGLESDIFNYLS